MNIKYLKDEKIEHRPEILNGLIAYNKIFVGESLEEEKYIYVFDEGKLVGACNTELGWNWVYIEALFYESQEVLITIMNELYGIFKDKSEGIIFESHINDRIEEFKVSGFEVLGTFDEKPVGFKSHMLVNKNMTKVPHNNIFTVEVVDEKDSINDKILEEQIKLYNEKFDIDDTKVEIEYVAYDGDKIIGGVHGYVKEDYLYVSILWVHDDYRGNDIATKLMELIEDESEVMGKKYSYLGTCTFQAKDFYKKLGYEVKMIVSNCPKGYDDFTMVKKYNNL